MKNRWKRLASIAVGCVMASTVAFGFVGCGSTKNPDDGKNPGGDGTTYVPKKGTYRTYTVAMPSDWNVFTSQSSNDSQIMDYIQSSFYEYDYKFDEAKGGKFNADGSINADAIVDGAYDVKYSAATAIEDVTGTVDAKWGYTEDDKETGGYAWKITFRDDLKWDDGKEIHAADFVYSMKEQLNPLFKHYRASEFYGQVSLKNARNYFYQGQSGWFDAHCYPHFEESIYDKIIFNIGNKADSEAYGGATCNMRAAMGFPESFTAAMTAEYLVSSGVKATAEEVLALQGKTFAEIAADATLKGTWDAVIGWWQTVPDEELDFFVSNYTYADMDFEEVGIYAASENELVVCLTTPLQFLKADKSLSYQAAYYMANLPLVHKEKYEASKQAPQQGSSLWTTNYCSSVENTASWGPFKLTQFQSGKSYTFERNENWYGYKLEDNKNQYNITSIFCEKLEQPDTRWTKFLNGDIDDIGIDVDHAEQYRNSKYTFFEARTGTLGIQLKGDLEKLLALNHNSGLLAISDFRKAVSLAVDRNDYNKRISTANKACYGVLNSMYYYDVENGATLDDGGVYRNTEQAKKGILRAYGYTEDENGRWSNGANVKNMSLDDAYDTLGGSNVTQAKALIANVCAELQANPSKYGFNASQKITLVYGSEGSVTPSTQHAIDYLQEMFDKITEGSILAGKIEVKYEDHGEAWAEDYQAGAYEICLGGFQNAPFNPGYMIGAHLMEDSTYHPDLYEMAEEETITLTLPAGVVDEESKELTMSVMNWYRCLNNQPEDYDQYDYMLGSGFVAESVRLEIIAALEEYILSKYYFIPTTASYTAAMLGAKFSYISEEYNTFMGFGGFRYMTVNYTDAEWATYKSNTNLENEYKKTDD